VERVRTQNRFPLLLNALLNRKSTSPENAI